LDLDTVYIDNLPLPSNGLIALIELVSSNYIETGFGTFLLTTESNVDISSSM